MSSYSSESSLDVPEVPYVNDSSSEVAFPHKEPITESDYFKFYDSLSTVNLAEIDQQELKAFASVLEHAPNAVKAVILDDPRLETFIYACIARADITISELLDVYAPPESPRFIKYIPILIWVFVSQKSKRFVEPLLVKMYEKTKSLVKDHIANITFGYDLGKLLHQPITNEEKDYLLIAFLGYYLQNLREVTQGSIKSYLAFVKNLVTGVENPSSDIKNAEDVQKPLPITLEYKISRDMLLVLLFIIAEINEEFTQEVTSTLKSVLTYSQKEVIPEGVYISQYLLSQRV